jgi:hypothetical protein
MSLGRDIFYLDTWHGASLAPTAPDRLDGVEEPVAGGKSDLDRRCVWVDRSQFLRSTLHHDFEVRRMSDGETTAESLNPTAGPTFRRDRRAGAGLVIAARQYGAVWSVRPSATTPTAPASSKGGEEAVAGGVVRGHVDHPGSATVAGEGTCNNALSLRPVEGQAVTRDDPRSRIWPGKEGIANANRHR